MKGFYVPGSRSGSYVASKKNEQGSYIYDDASIAVGIQKQAALQDLTKNYETTVSNAYASYLANQRTLNTSAMGEGYKELYKAAQDAALASQVAEANVDVANVRAQLNMQEEKAQAEVTARYEQEVKYLDRVAESMDNYLTYVKSLTDDAGATYLTAEQSNMPVEELYEVLYGAQPVTLYDEEGEAGLSYSKWMQQSFKDTAEDTAFRNWLFFGGGWQEFLKASKTNKSDV